MRAWAVTALTAVAWALLLAFLALRTYHGDIRGFVSAGGMTPWRQPPALADAPRSGALGYDGQFYATLATDPFLLKPSTVACLDTPSYRATRIGLPLLAWLLALGDARRAVSTYVLLCWAGTLLGVWVAARWLEEEGSAPLWALPLALGTGLLSCLMRAMPDAAAASCILTGLWLRKNGRPGSTWLLAFSCLVRETSILAAAAVALSELFEGRSRSALRALLLPLLVLFGWRLWVESRPGFVWFANLKGLTYPGLGWYQKLATQWPLSLHEWLAAGAVLLALFAFACGRGRLSAAENLVFGAFVLLALCLSFLVTEEFWAYGRALAVLPLLGTVLAIRAKTWLERIALRGMVIAFALSSAVYLLGISRWRSILSDYG